MDHKQRVQEILGAMSQGRVGPLFEAMADDVTWRWMGVGQWSRTFQGKQAVIDKLSGGAAETLAPSSSVEVHFIHADGEYVVAEHSGRNELPDGRRYDNNYCWVFRFRDHSSPRSASTWTPSWSPRPSGRSRPLRRIGTDRPAARVDA